MRASDLADQAHPFLIFFGKLADRGNCGNTLVITEFDFLGKATFCEGTAEPASAQFQRCGVELD